MTCNWKANEKINSWIVGCNNNYFYNNDDVSIVKSFKFCPYCGNEINVEFVSEPVYEWQWVWQDNKGYSHFTKYLTEEEAPDNDENEEHHLTKYEPSKKERK